MHGQQNKKCYNILLTYERVTACCINLGIYTLSIKSFPDYKRLLQENYLEYKHTFFFKCKSTQEVFFKHISTPQHVLLLLHGERLFDNRWFCFVIPQNTLGFLVHWRHFDTSRVCNCNITKNTWHKILETNLSNGKKKCVCIPRSFLVINICNQGKTLCSLRTSTVFYY